MGVQVSPLQGSQFSSSAASSQLYSMTFTSKNVSGDSLVIPVAGYTSVVLSLWPFSGGAGGSFISQVSLDGANWFNVLSIINGTGTSTLNVYNTSPNQSYGLSTFGSAAAPQIFQVNVAGAQFFRVACTVSPSAGTGSVLKAVAVNAAPIGQMIVNPTTNPVPQNLWQIGNQTISTVNIALQASQTSTIANGTTTRTTTTGLGIYNQLDILLNITAGGAATTGTLAIFLEDSADGGTTWDDVVSSVVFTFGSAAATQRFMLQGRIATTITQGTAAATETLAAGTVRQGPFGDRIRVREVVGAITGGVTGVTYTINAVGRL